MLKHITPKRLIIYSFLIWVIAYTLIPATYILHNSFYPVLVLVLYNAGLLFGLFSVKKVDEEKYKQPDSLPRPDYYTIVISFCIGVFGACLKLYQLIFVQNLLTVNGFALREAQIYSAEFNSGALGLIIALTFPFAIVSFLATFYYQKYFSKTLLIFSGLFASVYMLSSLLNESRLPMALSLFIFFIVWYFYQVRYGRFFYNNFQIKLGSIKLFKLPKFFTRWYVVLVFIAISVALSFSTKVMVNRLNHYNYKDVLTVWEGYHETIIDGDFKNEINKLPKQEKNIAVAKYSLYHYFAHGVVEFQRLVNHLDDKNGIYYGKYELDVYAKFFRFFGLNIQTKKEMNEVIYKRGYYVTFWGPFYLDFGLFGVFICFFLGRFIKKTYLKASLGYLPAILMYSYLAVNLMASLHVTFFGSSYMYIFNAIVVFWILRKLASKSTVVVINQRAQKTE
ncbi:O-antigen polymerase [Algibacter sp. AS12]|uniref:O-antigen polymerase n=1 Tax=Algibacter sp. AS12 TaxID=3135773 RepID=UPI00398AD051